METDIHNKASQTNSEQQHHVTDIDPIEMASQSQLPAVIKQMMELYQSLNYNNIESIKQVYRDDVEFIDPVHRIVGLKQLRHYFRGQYQNAQSISFEYHQIWCTQNPQHSETLIRWTMKLTHTRLNAAKPYQVDGMSQIKADAEKIFFQQDYFDLGELVYQRLPVIGGIIRWIKQKI